MSEMICRFLHYSLPCTLKVFYYFVIDLQSLKLIFPFVNTCLLNFSHVFADLLGFFCCCWYVNVLNHVFPRKVTSRKSSRYRGIVFWTQNLKGVSHNKVYIVHKNEQNNFCWYSFWSMDVSITGQFKKSIVMRENKRNTTERCSRCPAIASNFP